MMKKISLGLILIILSSSCVSKKVYQDLESRFENIKNLNFDISNDKSVLEKSKKLIELERDGLKKEIAKIKSEREKLIVNFDSLNKKYNQINESYSELQKNSGESFKSSSAKNRKLLEMIEAKEKALVLATEKLEKNNKNFKDIEGFIATKDMKMLNEDLSKSLSNFEANGLTVQQKNGKIHVTMAYKLLFNSGSWAVGSEGRNAIAEVGKILSNNPNFSVLVEGHTDNVPFVGSRQPIADNWALSAKRATAIVNILSENKNIDKQNLIAVGKGEFSPIASNKTAEGKAKNRRIEIILSPKLETVVDFSKEINKN